MMSAVKLACVPMECVPIWTAPLNVSVTQDMFFHLQDLHVLVSQVNFFNLGKTWMLHIMF